MTIDAATRVKLAGWLAEAESAYHALQTGARAVRLRHDLKEVSYAPADRVALADYIRGLRVQLTGAPQRPRSRPAFF